MANILYFGDSHPGATSAHRANALIRIGHNVDIYNPKEALKDNLASKLWGAIHYRTGYMLLQGKVFRWISEILQKRTDSIDLIWVDSGEFLGSRAVSKLKSYGCPVILYNVDDPTGKRDGNRFKSLLAALTKYDLVVVVRPETEADCRRLGAKNVLKVLRSYDEVAHKPFEDYNDIPESYRSDVAFIGTWMTNEGRDEFLLGLIKRGVPVSIWGGRWQKSPHWEALKPSYRGGALDGRNYVAAIQGAKICIGLLSKGNRDLHTQRSLETPYIGGVLCAERTSEHLEMYDEGTEAVFWNDVTECADKCKELLSNEQKRESIRRAGMEKVRRSKVGNEDVCKKILSLFNI